jgi:hypothetical protein
VWDDSGGAGEGRKQIKMWIMTAACTGCDLAHSTQEINRFHVCKL